jgi:N-acetylglucosamine kinase-like BadF-type ATPase
MGRNAEGRAARAGGWGCRFGDEGGVSVEGRIGPATVLHDAFLSESGDSGRKR